MEITFQYKEQTVTSYWWYTLNKLFSIKTEIICSLNLEMNIAKNGTSLSTHKQQATLNSANTGIPYTCLTELTDSFSTAPVLYFVLSILPWGQAKSICFRYSLVDVCINKYDIK